MKINYIKHARRIVKGHIYYELITDKQLTPEIRKKKLSKINEMLKDDEILLEFIKVAKNCLKYAQIELENKIKGGDKNEKTI